MNVSICADRLTEDIICDRSAEPGHRWHRDSETGTEWETPPDAPPDAPTEEELWNAHGSRPPVRPPTATSGGTAMSRLDPAGTASLTHPMTTNEGRV